MTNAEARKELMNLIVEGELTERQTTALFKAVDALIDDETQENIDFGNF